MTFLIMNVIKGSQKEFFNKRIMQNLNAVISKIINCRNIFRNLD